MNKDQTKDEGSCQTAYVDSENSATVECPDCGIRYTVNAGRVKKRGSKSRLRCKCGDVFFVFFEFRENPRRPLYVDGYYRPIKEVYIRGTIRTMPLSSVLIPVKVQNISRTGIGFIVPSGHMLKVADRIEIMFTLDDMEQTKVERNAVVRRLAKANYVGCEFTDIGFVDRTTGFVVMT